MPVCGAWPAGRATGSKSADAKTRSRLTTGATSLIGPKGKVIAEVTSLREIHAILLGCEL